MSHTALKSLSSSRRAGFTLVELLVVIGIIAILLGILMPAMATAREQSRKIKCMSNLRQIAMGAQMYTGQFKGSILPVSYYANLGDAAGRNWSDTWATLLVALKFLPYPQNAQIGDAEGSDNVFHCPSGILEDASLTTQAPLPATRTDGRGAMGYGNTSHATMGLQPGLTVYTWYGINGVMDTTTSWVPCSMIQGKAGGRKITQVKRSAETVFFFDGIWGGNMMTGNANRLTARHNKMRTTNIAFFDGHVETFETKDLPGGIGDANKPSGASTTFGLTNLKNFPYPIWRLDQ